MTHDVRTTWKRESSPAVSHPSAPQTRAARKTSICPDAHEDGIGKDHHGEEHLKALAPGWLPGCLAACLAGWLPGCLAAWLPGWLAGWLVGLWARLFGGYRFLDSLKGTKRQNPPLWGRSIWRFLQKLLAKGGVPPLRS